MYYQIQHVLPCIKSQELTLARLTDPDTAVPGPAETCLAFGGMGRIASGLTPRRVPRRVETGGGFKTAAATAGAGSEAVLDRVLGAVAMA